MARRQARPGSRGGGRALSRGNADSDRPGLIRQVRRVLTGAALLPETLRGLRMRAGQRAQAARARSPGSWIREDGGRHRHADAPGNAARGRPQPGGPAGAADWPGAARRPRAAARAARRPWKTMTGRASLASRRPGRRRDKAGAGTRMTMMPSGSPGRRRRSQGMQTSSTPQALSSWRSRSCGTGRTSRRSWSTAAARSGRWPPSWPRLTCWGSRPGGWRSWA